MPVEPNIMNYTHNFSSRQFFREIGPKLHDNGFLIVPIKPGGKASSGAGWQHFKFAANDKDSHPGHGVGILCGKGKNPIVGIDVDISHPTIVPAVIAWCRTHLGWSPERVGAVPRCMLVYRTSGAGWAKGKSVSFYDPTDPTKPSGKRNDQQIEVLGLGQQFVAYHVHPDTGKPYAWTDLFGGLEHVRASGLTVINEAQVDALMTELKRLVSVTPGLESVGAETSGAVAVSDDDWLLGQQPKTGVTLEKARALLLQYLDNTTGVDYDTWVKVGMSLHHEYDGSASGLSLWEEWARTSPKHQGGEAARKWRSFGKGSRQVSMRWLIRLGNNDGHDDPAMSDVQISRKLANHLAGRFLFDHSIGAWLIYEGGTWRECNTGEHLEAAKELGPSLWKEALTDVTNVDDAKRKTALAQRAMSKPGIDAALSLARSDDRLRVRSETFDTDPLSLNCKNGIVRLRTGELVSHSPDAKMKRQCTVEFTRQPTPTWDRFLSDISATDNDWVSYVQRLCGYVLTGLVREEIFVHMQGSGANGKSVFVNVLRKIMGNYSATIPAAVLMIDKSKNNSEGATPFLVRLAGARLALANEVEAGAKLSAQKIKDICSTEAIAARAMYGSAFEFTPTHKLLVRGNHLPVVTDTDDGIWRRIHLLPFDAQFGPGKRDMGLEDKLMLEAPGILGWMVQGSVAYFKEGLKPCRRVLDASMQYRNESDILGQWLEDCTEHGAGYDCEKQSTYANYRQWAIDGGLHPMAQISLTKALKEKSFGDGQRGGGRRERVYKGLRLRVDSVTTAFD